MGKQGGKMVLALTITSISKITKDFFGPSVEVFNVFNSNSNPGSRSLKSSSFGPQSQEF